MLEMGDEYRRKLRAMLVRMSCLEHDFVVRAGTRPLGSMSDTPGGGGAAGGGAGGGAGLLEDPAAALLAVAGKEGRDGGVGGTPSMGGSASVAREVSDVSRAV